MVFEMVEASRVQQTASTARQVEGLEQRVHRLEDAVAGLQDTRLLEERVVERLAGRINGNLPSPPSSNAGIIIEAGRHLLPARAEPADADAAYPGFRSSIEPGPRPPWLLLEIYEEFRAIYWMFVDPGYRLSWTGRLAPLAILFVLFSSWMFFSSFLWGVIDKVLSVVLIVILYKVLSREARRYRQLGPRFSSRVHR
jgi:hypothetical protein